MFWKFEVQFLVCAVLCAFNFKKVHLSLFCKQWQTMTCAFMQLASCMIMNVIIWCYLRIVAPESVRIWVADIFIHSVTLNLRFFEPENGRHAALIPEHQCVIYHVFLICSKVEKSRNMDHYTVVMENLNCINSSCFNMLRMKELRWNAVECEDLLLISQVDTIMSLGNVKSVIVCVTVLKYITK